MICSGSRPAGGHRSRFHIVEALGLVALVFAAGTSLAQGPAPAGSAASAESLTQALLAANLRYRSSARVDRPQHLSDLVRIAAARHQRLVTLITSDPGAVLRVALPSRLRASLPPAVQPHLEGEVDLDGVLLVLHEDYKTGSRHLHFLEARGARFSLHFAADPPALPSGSHVRVKGVRIGEALAVDSGTTSVQTLAAALPNTLGAQSTVVLLVNFQDNPIQPYTLDYARNVVFGTTSSFILENSFQQTWLTGNVYGWYTIPLNTTVCDQLKLASDARSAATAAGVNLAAYTRYVYAFPQNSCGWWGTATVGGSPSQAWINGSLELAVVGHEVGHNLGLEHSHSLVCSDGTTIGPNCTALEYGDGVDIMGWSSSAHFNAFQKERLGWLNGGVSPPITTVQTDGTYVLDLYESPGANPKALKILKRTDPTWGFRDWYYVEFRQAVGFDGVIASSTSTMDSGNLLHGVVIHMGSEGNGGNTNALLDMTPETYQLYTRDPALVVGRSFSDPDAGVTITAAWVTATQAAVTVSFGGVSCIRANPTVALSPSQSQGVQAGTTVAYTAWVTNNDGAGCTASSFNLRGTVPSGWTAAFAASALTLSPGASASTTLAVTSLASTADGAFTLQVTATNGANTTSAATSSAIYVITSALDVSAWTDKSSYSRGQTVALTARATAGGSPVANASVSFVIKKSNGAVVSQTNTTDSSGTAVLKYRLKRSDPVGLYQAGANAAKSPLSGSAATSFTVQ